MLVMNNYELVVGNPEFENRDFEENIQPIKITSNERYLQRIANGKVAYKSFGEIATSIHQLYSSESFVSGSSLFLVATAFGSYANHNSFTISPDTIWSLISDTVAKTVTINPDQHSNLFVKGKWNGVKEEIVIRNDQQTLLEPWDNSIELFKDELKKHVPEKTFDNFFPNFSTSAKMEKLSHLLTFMDAGSSYYAYTVSTCCGVPKINVTGNYEDYSSIANILEWVKSNFPELVGYCDYIQPIVMKIANSFLTSITDYQFWGDCVKKFNTYGSGASSYLTGWLGAFCGYRTLGSSNYLKDYSNDTVTLFDLSEIGPCQPIVEFVWDCNGTRIPMKFIGGVIGSEVHEDFIVPKFGYAAMTV
ncbi:MAG: DUF4419 domain-containing protein [Patescibacteria group bacterium]